MTDEPQPAAPHQPSVAPNTTAQQDITTAGQRRINMIWEVTQACIAILITGAAIGAACYAMVNKVEAPPLIVFLAGNVIGFYFSRTNHAAIGGIGFKPQSAYDGR